MGYLRNMPGQVLLPAHLISQYPIAAGATHVFFSLSAIVTLVPYAWVCTTFVTLSPLGMVWLTFFSWHLYSDLAED